MIEVNEYVRTKDRVIGKAIKVLSNRVFLDNLGYAVLIKDIVNHSKQLIDLIKIGDIVNGCIVVGFGHECVNGNKEKSILVEGKYTKVNYALLNRDIETILTKEQYLANCYKVGGEDDE